MNEILRLIKAHNLATTVRVLKRNDLLMAPQQIEKHISIVTSGALRIYTMLDDEEQDIRFSYTGSAVTALDSFISGKPTTFYIQALRKTEIIQINKTDFNTFIDSDHETLKIWNKVLLTQIQQLMEREIDLLQLSPKDRYMRVFNRSPQLFQEIPSKYIASYLRMTPETLSRLQRS